MYCYETIGKKVVPFYNEDAFWGMCQLENLNLHISYIYIYIQGISLMSIPSDDFLYFLFHPSIGIEFISHKIKNFMNKY